MKKRGARLGQHFLHNPHFAEKLVHATHATIGDVVLEIGPGEGALTREILKTGAHVVAIEKDGGLVKTLQERFSKEVSAGRLRILQCDIRDYEIDVSGLRSGEYIVAANIPYYITGEIIRQFLSSRVQPRTMALLVQKEVAERIVARGGKESILSLSVKAYGIPRIVAKVSAGNFSPPPSVDSAILVIGNISRGFFSDLEEAHFFNVVKRGFASKRKFLMRNLAVRFQLSDVREAFQKSGIPENARSEDLSLKLWKNLTLSLSPAPDTDPDN